MARTVSHPIRDESVVDIQIKGGDERSMYVAPRHPRRAGQIRFINIHLPDTRTHLTINRDTWQVLSMYII
jgi:hypothetical protein